MTMMTITLHSAGNSDKYEQCAINYIKTLVTMLAMCADILLV
jgi:hypothetical protein